MTPYGSYRSESLGSYIFSCPIFDPLGEKSPCPWSLSSSGWHLLHPILRCQELNGSDSVPFPRESHKRRMVSQQALTSSLLKNKYLCKLREEDSRNLLPKAQMSHMSQTKIKPTNSLMKCPPQKLLCWGAGVQRSYLPPSSSVPFGDEVLNVGIQLVICVDVYVLLYFLQECYNVGPQFL